MLRASGTSDGYAAADTAPKAASSIDAALHGRLRQMQRSRHARHSSYSLKQTPDKSSIIVW